MKNTAAVILAAGKGTRMKSKKTNKVMLEVGGKPLIDHAVSNLKKAGIKNIVIVVGFAKESITKHFNQSVSFAVQKEQLGTGHAFLTALRNLPEKFQTIVSVSGDDSFFYKPDLYKKMLKTHKDQKAEMTILTVVMDDPTGLGRVIRDAENNVTAIIEDKDSTREQKKIHEVNTGFYVFNREFVEEFINQITNKNASNEYYLTDILALAIENDKKVATVREANLKWRGVNQPEELEKANQQFSK